MYSYFLNYYPPVLTKWNKIIYSQKIPSAYVFFYKWEGGRLIVKGNSDLQSPDRAMWLFKVANRAVWAFVVSFIMDINNNFLDMFITRSLKTYICVCVFIYFPRFGLGFIRQHVVFFELETKVCLSIKFSAFI